MIELDNGYVFVNHVDWSLRPVASNLQKKPVKDVFIHHSVTTPSDDPCRDARVVEEILAERKLLPGYSYLVHPSGVVLECAGDHIGTHTSNKNSTSKGICFLGNFDKSQPTLAAIVAASRTINLMRLGGSLVPALKDITIRGHREVKSTACPGANLQPLLGHIRWFAGTNA